MKSTIILAASLFGSLAMTTPTREEKRYLVTSVVMETATVTVTADKGEWRSGNKATDAPMNTVLPGTSTSTTMVTVTAPFDIPAPPANTRIASSNEAYTRPILLQHNMHRLNHSAMPLQWNDDLANIAAEIAKSCYYAHNTEAGGGGYGQNIGAGAPPKEVNAMITNQMYNYEIELYPGYGAEPDMTNFEAWGHFSQIVWKDTTTVGCHTEYCANGLGNTGEHVSPYFTVCNYGPPGNFQGQYAANVIAPRGNAAYFVPTE